MSCIWVRSHELLGNSSKCRRLQYFLSPAQIRTGTLLVFSYNADSSPSLLSPKHSVGWVPNSSEVPVWRLWCPALLLTWQRTSHNGIAHLRGSELPYKLWTLQAFFCVKWKTSASSLTFFSSFYFFFFSWLSIKHTTCNVKVWWQSLFHICSCIC